MRRNISITALTMLLAGSFVLAAGGRADAQQKKGKEGAEKKKAAEEQMQKGTQGRDAAVDTLRKTGRGTQGDERTKKEKRILEHAGDPALAGGAKKHYRPKGLSEEQMKGWRDGSPPGWGRGGKTGWGEAGAPKGQQKKAGKGKMKAPRYPAGAGEWGAQEKEDFDRRIERARDRVREKALTREGIDEGAVESAEISVEEAAREGVPIEQAESSVSKAIDAGMSGVEIEQMTRAMAYGADKNVDYGELGSFVGTKIEDGERGDDLAVSIYEEVDRMEAQAPPEPEQPTQEKKTPWYKRIFGGD